MIKIFLDDERFPVDDTWIIFRSTDQAILFIKNNNFPTHLSLDHDLGDNVKTGFDFVKELIELMLDKNISPVGIDFYVHSQNPIGKENMIRYWKSFNNFYGENKLSP
jgi:hypothetical protein